MRTLLLIGTALLLGSCASSKPEPEPAAFSPAFEPPAVIETGTVRMEPLGPRHAELDYAAFMGSREHLRRTLRWGSWPSDDMTVEQNRSDLGRHEAEFEAREAYAYTVLTPDGRECVGCVYFDPARAPEGVDADPRSARLAYWVVEDRIGSGLDEHVVGSFLGVVEARFPIDEVAIMVRIDDERGNEVMTSLGLVEVESASEEHRVYVWRRAGAG